MNRAIDRQSLNQMNQGRRESDNEFIDLGRFFRAVMHYKWGILGLAFIFSVLSGLFVYSTEPVFQATASIALENQEANFKSVILRRFC